MKRLTIAALILIALTTGAFAHQGSIGLYVDTAHNDCDWTFAPYQAIPIVIMYFRSDAGPDGITAAEFRVEVPGGGSMIVISSFTPSPGVLTIGTIDAGIATSFTGCTGTGVDYTLIGTMSVLPFVVTPMQLKVLASGAITAPPYEPRVSMCDDPARTIVGVLGGWFTNPDGTCNLGTESKSWGAIKEMYKD
jgi:hypothetical protein